MIHLPTHREVLNFFTGDQLIAALYSKASSAKNAKAIIVTASLWKKNKIFITGTPYLSVKNYQTTATPPNLQHALTLISVGYLAQCKAHRDKSIKRPPSDFKTAL
tara:strand:- start:102 stop:416 length:315 start_codon:yes stop_codon:yes gene_type:complete